LNRLFFTSGNQYTGPDANFSDAIIALDLKSGRPVWRYQSEPSDIWRPECIQHPADCGKDADFGTIPVAFKGSDGVMLLGAGRKDGWFYAVDPQNGHLKWKTEIANADYPGKIYFANSTDGSRVFIGVSNAFKKNKQGFLCALDGASGRVLWRVSSADHGSYHGPITVTGQGDDELIFAGSTGNHIYAHRLSDGKPVWEWDTSGSVAGGVTVVDGVVYVGSGYGVFGIGNPNNKLYAFSIDGK
jgi:polyvinyl alcohol dehydrogenase (cytochrome)